MATRGYSEKGDDAPMESKSVSSVELQQNLEGVDYPAEKQDLIDAAKSNSAPDNIMSFMNRLPDKTYDQSIEVEEEFSKIE